MRIVNIEKLKGHKNVVLLGRPLHVEAVARNLVEDYRNNIFYCPSPMDYFEDYPEIAKEIGATLDETEERTVITTQNDEFVDTLLHSDIDFMVATVRTTDDAPGTFWLRVMSKDDAIQCRTDFNMELRV